MATRTPESRLPTAEDFALCACGHERFYHDETHCSCTQRCTCTGFVSPDLAYQRQLDAADRAREFATDGGW